MMLRGLAIGEVYIRVNSGLGDHLVNLIYLVNIFCKSHGCSYRLSKYLNDPYL